MRAEVDKVVNATRRLLHVLQPPFRLPGGYSDPLIRDHPNATADFLVTTDHRVLFLEGGPPYGAGAHPCCFHGPPSDWINQATYLHDGIPVALDPGKL